LIAMTGAGLDGAIVALAADSIPVDATLSAAAAAARHERSDL
jgi:hypothetical protein